ncbi:TPA: hypothetical protein TZR59_000894 [Streptococcus suis]|nr:hypothetical protein [Streptococcus suis]
MKIIDSIKDIVLTLLTEVYLPEFLSSLEILDRIVELIKKYLQRLGRLIKKRAKHEESDKNELPSTTNIDNKPSCKYSYTESGENHHVTKELQLTGVPPEEMVDIILGIEGKSSDKQSLESKRNEKKENTAPKDKGRKNKSSTAKKKKRKKRSRGKK